MSAIPTRLGMTLVGIDNNGSPVYRRRRPRLLDLFCGGGGAAMGYHRAGFEVIGADIEPQPHYPFEFHQADALEVLAILLAGQTWEGYVLSDFDAIHASPPCQHDVQWNNLNRVRYGSVPDHPELIPPTRDLLVRLGLPYVMENVIGSTIRTTVALCGSAFGLGVRRHRIFESNVLLMGPPKCRHTGDEIAVYGWLDGRRIWTRADGSEVRAAKTLDQAQAAMGVDWMEWDELRESVPPAYTEWIGSQLLAAVLTA